MNSNNLTIALAQISVMDGELEANLKQHLGAIKQAAQQGADLVMFPELSLSGYALSRAEELALDSKHSVLRDLSEQAVVHQITIIVGCFLQNGTEKPTISAVICNPTGELNYYAKQYLHVGEEQYCSAGKHNHYLRLKGYKLALAICADFSNPQHGRDAGEDEADIYLASALISATGYSEDAKILANLAATYRMPVLLSNHISDTGGWQAAGNSAVWNADGTVAFAVDNTKTCLGLVEMTGNQIVGRTYFIHN
ncbi:carbon-nitrogen hydrolase family protein [Vibrio sp. 404]|uniref:Carbon-nitrogen hydrolase family protein n=1 Tax=Vibrio marinisediminis TaxID=2758441 RepID=A0A7W2FT84_9VIBR|nr:carbon-nitrogen hydrolase family protein [Vibrio marinisediminis]MBA5763785.1 carbon-nitrogen hydrolase family protein [Vibrio marinisediminis]